MLAPKDHPLASFTEEQLLAEYERRVALRRKAHCDYCGGAWESPVCDQPQRHTPRRSSQTQPQGTLTLSGPPGCGKTTIASLYRQLAEQQGLDLTIVEVQT